MDFGDNKIFSNNEKAMTVAERKVKMRADTEAVRNQTDLVNSRDMNEL
jgi:hypothetical protein